MALRVSGAFAGVRDLNSCRSPRFAAAAIVRCHAHVAIQAQGLRFRV